MNMNFVLSVYSKKILKKEVDRLCIRVAMSRSQSQSDSELETGGLECVTDDNQSTPVSANIPVASGCSQFLLVKLQVFQQWPHSCS